MLEENKSLPLVTIGITCFNAESSIERAIEGAILQDYSNTEIIIVDDCSSDRSIEVIERKIRGVEKARLIKNSTNLGASACFNMIADAASGQYVALFDDDDYSLPCRVSESLRVLNGAVDKIFFCDRFVNQANAGHTFGIRPLSVEADRLRRYMADALYYHLDTKFYRNSPEFFTSVKGHGVKGSVGSGIMTCPTDIMRSVRFNEELRRYYDTEFNLRAAAAGYCAVGSETPCMIQTITESEDKGVPYTQLSILKSIESNRAIFKELRIIHPLDARFDAVSSVKDNRSIDGGGVRASIGILTYNCIDTIGYALHSALNQTENNIEVIIVDDCSTDGTSEFLRKYSQKDARIRLIQNKQNMGAGYSRGVVVEEARGEFLVFFDDDDVSKINRVEQQIKHIEDHGLNTICISRFNHFSNSKFLGPRNPFGFYGDFIHPNLANRLVWNEVLRHTAARYLMPQTGIDASFHYALGTSLMAGHISAFRRFPFDERLRRMQDLEFLLRFTASGGSFIQSEEILINIISTETVDKSWNVIFNCSSHILAKHSQELRERFNMDADSIIELNNNNHSSGTMHYEKVKGDLVRAHDKLYKIFQKTKRILGG